MFSRDISYFSTPRNDNSAAHSRHVADGQTNHNKLGITMKNLAALAAIALFTCTTASAEDLRIGTSADYPPWESVNENNEIVGFDRDFGDELCRRIEANCTWINQAYDGLLPALQIGKFDAVISGISITEERAKMVDFSSAYADAPNSVIGAVDAGFGTLDTPADLLAALADKTVGVQTGTTHEQVVKAHFEGATLRSYDRPDQIVNDLLAGRIDAAMMETSAAEPFLKGDQKDKLSLVGPLLTSADFAEFGQGQGVALGKGKQDLQGRMDAAIAEMLADGTMAKLSETWFGYDLSAK
ncbi:transporter substrate-binding domain-containing protein [Shimia sp. R10_1]|uniref:transporter substrate-binding domain-containing protein n=1 Tax=Shimia sp. R10_1 TaxID=2821095 RepID=UPI001FFE130E|nr:transporter substrate-binding domain-containing protein [Shimia sp. R10_1]